MPHVYIDLDRLVPMEEIDKKLDKMVLEWDILDWKTQNFKDKILNIFRSPKDKKNKIAEQSE